MRQVIHDSSVKATYPLASVAVLVGRGFTTLLRRIDHVRHHTVGVVRILESLELAGSITRDTQLTGHLGLLFREAELGHTLQVTPLAGVSILVDRGFAAFFRLCLHKRKHTAWVVRIITERRDLGRSTGKPIRVGSRISRGTRHTETKASLGVTPGTSRRGTLGSILLTQTGPVVIRNGIVRGNYVVIRLDGIVRHRIVRSIVVVLRVAITRHQRQVLLHRFSLIFFEAKLEGCQGTPNAVIPVVAHRLEAARLVGRTLNGTGELGVAGHRQQEQAPQHCLGHRPPLRIVE